MSKQNMLILSIGIFLIFLSLYVFTRPAIFDSWNFTQTGQIGDTIGGISGPIINLIGAYLVYISFQAQIEANRIQAKALKDEKERIRLENIYQKQISQFDDIKITLRQLEFIVELEPDWSHEGGYSTNAPLIFKGLNALNEYTNRLLRPERYGRQKYETYGMFLNFQFMMISVNDLIINVQYKIDDPIDKEFLLNNIKHFYNNFLKTFAERIIEHYGEDHENLTEIIRINKVIEETFSA